MNISKKYIIFTILIIVIVFSFLFIYSKTKNEIIVGVILPLTGQYSVIGESIKKSMEMSLDTLSQSEKTRIRLVFEDDKYTAKDALSAYQKLTSLDHVDIIISISSPAVEIIKPEINKNNQIMFILGDELSHNKDNVFQIMPQGAGLFTSLALEVEKENKNISVVYASDNNLFKTNADLFKSSAPVGLKVELVPIQSNSDLRTEILQVIESKLEAFTLFVPLETGIKVLKEMKKYSTRPKLICDANMALTIEQYIQAIGHDIFNGCIATVMSETKTPEFVDLYKKTYLSDPQFGSDFGYDIVQIINQLIKNNKNLWVKILNNDFKYTGSSGVISFDDTGTRASYIETRIFKNGEFIEYSDK